MVSFISTTRQRPSAGQYAQSLWAWGVAPAPLPNAIARYGAAIALCAGLVAWVWPRATNLASNKTVLMSGTCGIRPTHSPYPVEPARLVDGRLARSYDACTAPSVSPWVRIDLGSVVPVGRVAVYGRQDCCWEQGVPLLLELSSDGSVYDTVARRLEPFTQDDPWLTELGSHSARFVRLRVEGQKRALIALSEVEVFPP